MADQGESSNGRRGRQRRQVLRRIANEDARQVTFSKRRKGLFKKASELATLCGVEVGILVNSPAGRPYTFGSPAVETVFDRFLSNNPHQPNQALVGNERMYQRAMINDLNQQYTDLKGRLDASDFQRALLNERLKRTAEATPEGNWSKRIDELQIDELRQLFDTLCKTKARIVARQNEIIRAQAASSSHASVANYPGQTQSSIIGNSPFADGSHSVQTNQINMGSTEPGMFGYIQPNLSINPRVGGLDLSLRAAPETIPGLVPNSGGVNNALMPVQYGFGFGSNSAIQNPSTAGYGTNTDLFIDPNGFGQSYGMNNQPMSYNFNSNILQPNNPLGGINLGSNQFESDSLEGLVGPYSSTSQGQFLPWGTGNLARIILGVLIQVQVLKTRLVLATLA
ncbi:Agamous-like MADS-box protein AGL61 [Carex littledalei]|uniref:Agamous-like MADS-box protein AGL61 n=1 Tax=Carex littledalei TaxID=544730 RepID=A0A833QE77_9POAL|nr:Agamous-like MADS-box protein AGL61 [Carex littledalei]